MNPPLTDINRILIFKFKHIGDVLLSVPVLNAVAKRFPKARIDYLVSQGTEALIQDHPRVTTVFRADRHHPLWRQWRQLMMLRRYCYDLSIDLSGGGDRGAIASRVVGARWRVGKLPAGHRRGMRGKAWCYNHIVPASSPMQHSIHYDLALIRYLGIPVTVPKLDMHIPASAVEQSMAMLRQAGIDPASGLVLVHPTARWLFKCIADATMATVIDRIASELHRPVVVTCGPNTQELARLNAIVGRLQSRPAVFAGDLSLPQLGAMIQAADVFLGVDSAPMHMAAALNTPALALFGPTSVYNWGPWPNDPDIQNPYLNRNGMQRCGRHTVLQQRRDCQPCGQAGCLNSRISDCLNSLNADDIIAELSRMLSRLRGQYDIVCQGAMRR